MAESWSGSESQLSKVVLRPWKTSFSRATKPTAKKERRRSVVSIIWVTGAPPGLLTVARATSVGRLPSSGATGLA